MKKTLLYALAAVFAISGMAETTPASAADRAPAGSRDAVRDAARAEGLSGFAAGDLQQVRHTREHRRRQARHRRAAPNRYSLRYIHRRGKSCSRWVGRRCYYTPSGLRPFRQR